MTHLRFAVAVAVRRLPYLLMSNSLAKGVVDAPVSILLNPVSPHTRKNHSGDPRSYTLTTPLSLDTPLFLGEFWLLPAAGAFDYFDKTSAQAFGDAQKMGYSPEGGAGGIGWYFWSWKMTNDVRILFSNTD